MSAVVCLMSFALLTSLSDARETSPAAVKSLKYLSSTDIPEVVWYEIDGNEFFIGINRAEVPSPTEFDMLIRVAASNWNRAIGFGFRSYAADADVAKRG